MAEELFIPKLGQTVEQVTLINWLVKDGDKVKQGQEVLEVETDKAVFNVEAVDDGFIHMGPFKAGDVLPVLAVAYCAPPGSTVLLEEPEIHLHPLAQAVLAEVFAEVSQQRFVHVGVIAHGVPVGDRLGGESHPDHVRRDRKSVV